jgi:hypothetical protein
LHHHGATTSSRTELSFGLCIRRGPSLTHKHRVPGAARTQRSSGGSCVARTDDPLNPTRFMWVCSDQKLRPRRSSLRGTDRDNRNMIIVSQYLVSKASVRLLVSLGHRRFIGTTGRDARCTVLDAPESRSSLRHVSPRLCSSFEPNRQADPAYGQSPSGAATRTHGSCMLAQRCRGAGAQGRDWWTSRAD